MGRTVPKASYFDASYQRRDLYEKGPAQGSLRATKSKPGTLSKRNLVDINQIGMSTAFHGHSRPSTVLNHQGITPTLPAFDGQPSKSLISWLIDIKCYFLSQYIPKSEWCEVAVSCLKGSALIWYDLLNFSRRMEGKRGITSWHKLEFHMKKRFTFSCTMSDLTTQLETLKQNPLNINKNAKPNTQPLPGMKPKLKDIQTSPNPKPEFNEPTKLELTCSLNAMNCVSNACIAKHLNPIESGHLTVDHEGSDESINPAQLKPSKLTKTDLTPTHCENMNQLPNQNSKKPICCVSIKTQRKNQPILHPTHEISESLVKLGLRVDPYFPLCPKMNHLNPNLIPHPISETCVILDETPKPFVLNNSKGNLFPNGDINQMTGYWPELSVMSVRSPDISRVRMACALLTPHFHFFMLLRIQASLEHLGAISYTIRIRNGNVNSNNYQLSKGNVVECFKQLGSLKFDSGMISVLLEGVPNSEMITLDHSKWKLNFNGGKDQKKPCCPALNLLGLGVDIVGNPYKDMLKLLGKSNTNPLHTLGEISGMWVMFKGETHWEPNKGKPPEIFWVFACPNQPTLLGANPLFTQTSHQKETSHLAWLGHKGVRSYLKFPQKGEPKQSLGNDQIIEYQLSNEHPQNYFKIGSIKKSDGKRVFDPDVRTNTSSRRHSEFGKVSGLIKMHLIMVFDPGGSMPHPNFEMIRICFWPNQMHCKFEDKFFSSWGGCSRSKGYGSIIFNAKKYP